MSPADRMIIDPSFSGSCPYTVKNISRDSNSLYLYPCPFCSKQHKQRISFCTTTTTTTAASFVSSVPFVPAPSLPPSGSHETPHARTRLFENINSPRVILHHHRKTNQQHTRCRRRRSSSSYENVPTPCPCSSRPILRRRSGPGPILPPPEESRRRRS
jgi:hypothetical protein